MFRITAPYPAPVDTMLLRSPQFSNQANQAHTMTTIRTGDGTLYTYIKKKRGRRVFQWDFLVSYKKSLEVKLFWKAYTSSLVRVYDHDGDVFTGYVTVNPWEAQGEGRAGGWAGNEAYSFTLQLEEFV